MNASRKIAIRADANSTIGMGHVMRCSAVASMLQKHRAEVCYLISPDSTLDMVEGLGYKVYQLKEENELGWSPAEVVQWVKDNNVDALFVDTYRVTKDALSVLDKAATLFYLDDLYAFDYPVSNIINYNLEADKKRYLQTNYSERNLFLGAQYFPVRKQISDAKIKNLNNKVSKILITTGSTDPCRMSLGILETLTGDADLAGIKFTVLLGRYYDEEYRMQIEQFIDGKDNIELISWTKDMGALYASCDLVIAPGSTTIFEAFTVGVPCISFCFVDNQIFQCEAMKNMDMAPYCGDFRSNYKEVLCSILAETKKALDYKVRENWYSKYSEIFDGYGAERMACVLLDKQLYKRRGGGKGRRHIVQFPSEQ